MDTFCPGLVWVPGKGLISLLGQDLKGMGTTEVYCTLVGYSKIVDIQDHNVSPHELKVNTFNSIFASGRSMDQNLRGQIIS